MSDAYPGAQPPAGSFASALSSFVRTVALQNALELRVLSRLNEVRFALPQHGPAWKTVHDALRGFLAESRRDSYPVRLLRNVLPTQAIMNSTDAGFSMFLRDLLTAIGTSDERVAHWYRKRLVVYKAVIDLPFAPVSGRLPEIRAGLLSLATRLTTKDSTVLPAPATTSSVRPSKSEKETTMGATFDLVGPESLKRSIFQYWVYNTDTDEIAAEGSFIAKGDTLQEATRNLLEGLRTKLAALASPSLKVHVKMIDQFTKQERGGAKSLAEQFVDAVRDEIKREGPK